MRSPSPFVAWTTGALLGSAALAGVGLYGLNWQVAVWPVLAVWLVAVTCVTASLYWFDKHRAERGGRRVPEATLHALAAAGGSPGALLGMKLFRHKTIKGRFRVVFWLIVATQLVLLAWAAKDAWGASAGR